MPTSDNKSVVFTPAFNDFDNSIPQLQKVDFGTSIDTHGSEITVERANRCPCAGDISGQPKAECTNCGGFGWFFYNLRTSRAVFQRVNRGNKYLSWNEYDFGKASVSFRPDEDIAFMDRVVDLNRLSEYSQICRLINVGGGVYKAQTVYKVESITAMFLFSSVSAPLVQMALTDVSYTGNTIILINNSLISGFTNTPTISIRYKHNPVYHVLEVTRENAITRDNKQQDIGVSYDNPNLMPIHAICLKANEIFDKKTIYGETVNDNTNTTINY